MFAPTEEPSTTGNPSATTSQIGLPSSDNGKQNNNIIDSGTWNLPSDTTSNQTQKPADKTNENYPSRNQANSSVINNAPSFGVTRSSDGNSLNYYNKNDGKFYRLDSDGNAKLLSERVFHDVNKITWSPTKNKAVLEYPDNSKIIYDFDANKQISLPKHWKDFSFSTDGEQLAMKSMGLDPENRFLAITNEDASKIRAIEPMGTEDDTVYPSWSPNNQSIALHTKGIDYDRQDVYFIGLNKENFKSMTVEGRGFQFQWSPTGDRLLYSVYSADNDYKPTLWLSGAQGEDIGANRRTLKVDTWASKCNFASSQKVYCAVPNNMEKGWGMFPETAQKTTDDLYEIDTVTGTKRLINIPDGKQYNIDNIVVSQDLNNLFFVDTGSQNIHKVSLK